MIAAESKTKNASPDRTAILLQNFDALPDSALVPSKVVRLWDGGISEATLWRRIGAGLLPKPEPVGGWLVGKLRIARADRNALAA